jgi:polyisoprenoid-binding protein YceI
MIMLNSKVRQLAALAAATALLLSATTARAQWVLDGAQSMVNFISVKNAAIAEVHSFTELAGSISANGEAQVLINLGSVETLIPIRNERMREMLFDTANFAKAKVSAVVTPDIIATAAEGGTAAISLPATLSLHGIEKSLAIPVVVVGDEEGSIQVFSTHPVLINAADFGLEAGVAALQAVAGLKSVSTAVPVTFHLAFSRKPEGRANIP